VWQQYV